MPGGIGLVRFFEPPKGEADRCPATIVTPDLIRGHASPFSHGRGSSTPDYVQGGRNRMRAGWLIRAGGLVPRLGLRGITFDSLPLANNFDGSISGSEWMAGASKIRNRPGRVSPHCQRSYAQRSGARHGKAMSSVAAGGAGHVVSEKLI